MRERLVLLLESNSLKKKLSFKSLSFTKRIITINSRLRKWENSSTKMLVHNSLLINKMTTISYSSPKKMYSSTTTWMNLKIEKFCTPLINHWIRPQNSVSFPQINPNLSWLHQKISCTLTETQRKNWILMSKRKLKLFKILLPMTSTSTFLLIRRSNNLVTIFSEWISTSPQVVSTSSNGPINSILEIAIFQSWKRSRIRSNQST